jgi:hypothetical protein
MWCEALKHRFDLGKAKAAINRGIQKRQPLA